MSLKFPRNVAKQRAMLRLSIHQRRNEITETNRASRSTQTNLATIYLYMPQSVQFNDGLTYENVDLSSGLGILMDTVNLARSRVSGGDVTGGSVVDYATTAIATKAAGSGGFASGAASQALINSGQVLNPRTQMLFKGPVLRQFSFGYKFIPSNRDEAEDIFNIIKTIRTYAYPLSRSLTIQETEETDNGPETTNTVVGDGTFIFPDIFRIEMVQNEGEGTNLKMIKIADTYCTAVSTNYNPTANAFHAGGYPSEVDLTLTFQELTTLDRGSITRGY